MKKYENYVSALSSLRKAPEQDLTNEFVQSGIVDKFKLLLLNCTQRVRKHCFKEMWCYVIELAYCQSAFLYCGSV